MLCSVLNSSLLCSLGGGGCAVVDLECLLCFKCCHLTDKSCAVWYWGVTSVTKHLWNYAFLKRLFMGIEVTKRPSAQLTVLKSKGLMSVIDCLFPLGISCSKTRSGSQRLHCTLLWEWGIRQLSGDNDVATVPPVFMGLWLGCCPNPSTGSLA